MANNFKSSQVSPNARRRAQCKGGGGKEKKYMYTKKCETPYNLQASLRERRRNNYIEQKSRKHGKRDSHRAAFLATISQLPKALYLQNISNFVSQVCCGRPRGGHCKFANSQFFYFPLHRKECRQWNDCYSGNIWQTGHCGKSCRACLRTLGSPCINTLRWISLLRCLKHCSLEPGSAFATKSFDRGTLDTARIHGSS